MHIPTQGHEFIGVIEQIGSDVSKFAVGDEVVSLFSPVWYVYSCFIDSNLGTV
jgi:Zn-dependent alcohol dehydrogenase